MSKKPLDRKKPRWGTRLSFMPFYCFVRDEKMWRKVLKKIKMDDTRVDTEYPPRRHPGAYAMVTTFTDHDRGTKYSLLTMPEGWMDMEPVAIVALIAHEAAHIWQEVEFTTNDRDASQEYEAHMIQEIMANLMWGIEHVTGWTIEGVVRDESDVE